MFRVCFDDPEILDLLTSAAEDLARAAVPAETALQKRDGGAQGIATGTSFRRLVAEILARQFGKEVEEVCSPFQCHQGWGGLRRSRSASGNRRES